MTSPAWLALGTTITVFMALQLQRRVPADVLFISGTIFLALCGIITPARGTRWVFQQCDSDNRRTDDLRRGPADSRCLGLGRTEAARPGPY